LLTIGESTLFISRLPASYNECLRVIKEAIGKDQWQDLGVLSDTKPTGKRPAAHYKAYESEVNIHNKKYRAVVIHSSAHDKRRQKRIERELNAELKSLNHQCKQAAQKDFYYLADALAAKEELGKTKAKYYIVKPEVEKNQSTKAGGQKEVFAKLKKCCMAFL